MAHRFTVDRWWEADAATQAAWLADHGVQVRAVVTGAHIGSPDSLIKALPNLGIIAINGVGFDKVNLLIARARGVLVSNTPDVLTEDVADLAVGLTIGLIRKIAKADAYVRAGEWGKGSWPLARKVSGRRFGIVGLGRIGTAIAKRLQVFGPVAYTGTRPRDVPWSFHADPASLAARSDVLVIACAATEATRGLIDAKVLSALGPEGFLVNVARGSIVDEEALLAAVIGGGIAGAALDVFTDEPHVKDAFITARNTLLTPHMASATTETRRAMADLVLANLDAFLAGQPIPSAVT